MGSHLVAVVAVSGVAVASAVMIVMAIWSEVQRYDHTRRTSVAEKCYCTLLNLLVHTQLSSPPTLKLRFLCELKRFRANNQKILFFKKNKGESLAYTSTSTLLNNFSDVCAFVQRRINARCSTTFMQTCRTHKKRK